MDIGVQKGINDAIRKLNGMERHVRKYIKQDLGEASNILTSALKGAVPVGTKPHGKYRPGNLRRSIRKLPLRRSRSSVLVGPLARGGAVDGFYAKFLEFGTRHIAPTRIFERTEARAGPVALRVAFELLERRVNEYSKKIEI